LGLGASDAAPPGVAPDAITWSRLAATLICPLHLGSPLQPRVSPMSSKVPS
jgi:hypothetical protein